MKKKRDYKKEYREFQGKPEQIARRSARNKSRSLMIKKHGKAALKNADVDHKDFNPKNMSPKNLRIMPVSKNRGRKPPK